MTTTPTPGEPISLPETLALSIKLGIASVDFAEQAEADVFLHKFACAVLQDRAHRAASPDVAKMVELPDDGELEAWRATADDLLRCASDSAGLTRRAAHLLQNAYLFARDLVSAPQARAAVGAEQSQDKSADDMLTVAHVTTDGGGILTMLAASLGDLIDIVGDEPETYSVSIATMKRTDFEAMGEFDAF